MAYCSYVDVVNDYLDRMAFSCMLYKFDRGEFMFECDRGRLFVTSAEWGWYPYRGKAVNCEGLSMFGVQELLAWLRRVESWL